MKAYSVLFALFLVFVLECTKVSVGLLSTTPRTSLLPNNVALTEFSDGSKRWTSRNFVVDKFRDGTVKIAADGSEWKYSSNGEVSILTPNGKWTRNPTGAWSVFDARGPRPADPATIPVPPRNLILTNNLQPTTSLADFPTLLPQFDSNAQAPTSLALSAPMEMASTDPSVVSSGGNAQVLPLSSDTNVPTTTDSNQPLPSNNPNVLSGGKVTMESLTDATSSACRETYALMLAGALVLLTVLY